MTRKEYLNLCLTMPRAWLIDCAANPSIGMTPMHIKLCLIAIKKGVWL